MKVFVLAEIGTQQGSVVFSYAYLQMENCFQVINID